MSTTDATSAEAARISVGIVDDEKFARQALQAYLSTEDDIDVVATAENGAGALELVRDRQPDVLLLDLQMPDLDGIEVTRRIIDMDVATRVIVVTAHISDRYVTPALVAGASGYVVKDSEPQRVINAVHEVMEGGCSIDPQITRHLVEAVGRGSSATDPREVDLSDREQEVLSELCSGHSNSEIAATLFLSESTVKYYLANLMQKFDSRDRVQLVVKAFRTGAVT